MTEGTKSHPLADHEAAMAESRESLTQSSTALMVVGRVSKYAPNADRGNYIKQLEFFYGKWNNGYAV